MPKSKQNPSKDRFRTSESLRRVQRRRKPRPCILIVCEGTATEPHYFNELRKYYKLSTVDVCVVGTGVSPVSLVKQAISLRDIRIRKVKKALKKGELVDPEFDQVWCVFDTEREKDNNQFLQAVELAEKNSFDVAVSNPSFEYWYLLHYEETNRPFTSSDELCYHLCKYIPGYEKSLPVFHVIYDATDVAISRSKRNLETHPETDKRFPNPSTHVHLLVLVLKDMTNY